jgi:protease-4
MRFLERVSEARGKTVEEVDALGQGRVWTGAQALERGLVDELGGVDRAIALAREKAGIPERDSVQLVIFPRKKSVLEVLVREMVSGASRLSVGESLNAGRVVARSPVLRMLAETDRLALMPYRVEIR